MTDRDAMIASICNLPDEDPPRLMYADWLDEHDAHTRAEFIRLQIALAGMAPDDPKRPGVVARKDELIRLHGDEWAGEVGPSMQAEWAREPDPHRHEVFFRRGFIGGLKCPAEVFERQPDLRGHVPLRELHLGDASGRVGRVVASPSFSALTTLSLFDLELRDDDIIKLAESSNARRLTNLTIFTSHAPSDVRIGDAGLSALAGADFFPWLESLKIVARLEPAGVWQLVNSGLRTRLRELQLEFTAFDDSAAFAMATGGFEELTTLAAYGCNVGDEGLLALATSPALPRLTRLALCRGRITSAGVTRLAASPSATRLRQLDLDGNTACALDVEHLDSLHDAHPQLQIDTRYARIRHLLRARDLDHFTTREFVDAAGATRSGPAVSG